jgi:tetratricopeptide (TPR) repeat protein
MHPKSEYVEIALYDMALAYFYKNEWLPCQVKCAEIIDKFPDGDMAADGLLIYSKTLLIQKKFDQADVMLSRTVDMAWQKKKYDILSQAFRLQAESHLFRYNLDEAVKPYKQAIVQSDDKKLKSRWQLDLGLLYYKIGKFEKAIKEFDRVFLFSPDYITHYEAKLYTANAYAYLDNYEKADQILTKLEKDGKFEEWKASTFASRLLLYRLKGEEENLAKGEKLADSAYTNNPHILATYYLRGQELYDSNNYNKALHYFTKAKVTRTPVLAASTKMSNILSTWKLKNAQIFNPLDSLQKNMPITDSTKSVLAKNLFELGRVHEQLGHKDSVDYYYDLACKFAPDTENESAKYFYVNALNLESRDLKKSDSLMEIVVNRYTLTDYGKAAMKKLGYTQAFIIDTVQEIFDSGTELMFHNEYQYAIMQFNTILTKYPGSKLEPRTLYSIGWLYESKLKNYDSALFYYQILVEKYPKTSYAEDVRLSVEYMLAKNTGKEIPDYLKERQLEAYRPEQDLIKLLQPPPPTQIMPKKDEFRLKDIFSNPSKLLEQGKELIDEKIDKVKNIDFRKQMDSLKGRFSLDSLNVIPKLNIQEAPTEMPPDTTKR